LRRLKTGVGSLLLSRLREGEATKKWRYTEEQAAYALRLAESGTPAAKVCRPAGIAEATFYLWKE